MWVSTRQADILNLFTFITHPHTRCIFFRLTQSCACSAWGTFDSIYGLSDVQDIFFKETVIHHLNFSIYYIVFMEKCYKWMSFILSEALTFLNMTFSMLLFFSLYENMNFFIAHWFYKHISFSPWRAIKKRSQKAGAK